MILSIIINLKKIFNYFDFINRKFLFRLNVLEIYLRQNECDRYRDCFKLQELYCSSPPISERYVEYTWLADNFKNAKVKILDVGTINVDLFAELMPKDSEKYAIDINQAPVFAAGVNFVKGDIRRTDFSDNFFDHIICISTLEHIGISGRYHSDDDPLGDIKAMREIYRILKPQGSLFVSIPFGAKDILPFNRVYQTERAGRLFENFQILEKRFYRFDYKWLLWTPVSESVAAATDPEKDHWYALALFKAKKR